MLICIATFWNEREYLAVPENETEDNDLAICYALGDIPPRYPVPATLLDCTLNHEQWRVQQYLNNKR